MAPGSSKGGPPGAAQQHRATGNGAEGGQDPRDASGPEEAAMGQSPRRGCRISPKAPHSGAGGVHRPPQGHTQSHFQLMWEGGGTEQQEGKSGAGVSWLRGTNSSQGARAWPRSIVSIPPQPPRAQGGGSAPGREAGSAINNRLPGLSFPLRVTTASCPPHSRSPEDFAGRPGAPARCDANAAPDITPARGRRGTRLPGGHRFPPGVPRGGASGVT